MSKLIEGSIAEGGRIVDDAWATVDAIAALHGVPPGAAVLVPLALWKTQREALLARRAPLGVRLEPDDEPADLVDDLSRLSLVAVHFPKFTDGRGYSTARLLRERHGYRGRLRAVGDVLHDQLFYMLRCGFDSFALKHQDMIADAPSAYRVFSEGYQSSVDRPVPLFKRRAAGANDGGLSVPYHGTRIGPEERALVGLHGKHEEAY